MNLHSRSAGTRDAAEVIALRNRHDDLRAVQKIIAIVNGSCSRRIQLCNSIGRTPPDHAIVCRIRIREHDLNASLYAVQAQNLDGRRRSRGSGKPEDWAGRLERDHGLQRIKNCGDDPYRASRSSGKYQAEPVANVERANIDIRDKRERLIRVRRSCDIERARM